MSNVLLSGPDLWQYARTLISGGTGLLSKRAERFDAREWPAYFSRCSGCEVWDLDGRRFIDFAGGVGAILLGYADADVNAAVERRVSNGNYCTLVSPEEVELAELLLELHPWAGRVRFARGGGEAMAIAVRIARAATGRSGVAFCGYHGWQDWYLAANLGEDAALDGHLLPGLQPLGVPRELAGTAHGFRYNELESFETVLASLGDDLAAVVMEPMRAQWPTSGFLETVAVRCRERGAVFILDEVTSGWRYGWPGAHAPLGIEPDIAVYAKAMSNGFPAAAIVGRPEVMDAANASFISSSYWTDGIGTTAALASLRKMASLRVQSEVWRRGKALQTSLHEIAGRYPQCELEIGGMPPSPSLNFNLGPSRDTATVLLTRGMLRRGFLLGTQVYVMWAHEGGHIASFLEALEETVAEIAELVASSAMGTEELDPGFRRLC